MIGHLFKVTMGMVGWVLTLAFSGVIIAVIAGYFIFQHYTHDLPDYTTLENYDPPTVTRLYAADGRLLAEYAKEKRVFIPLSAMPKQVVNAFIAAEDQNFYEHAGVDPSGIARAVYTNILNYGQGRSLVGGSTITQQVVKNFLLTNEQSFERKIKEAILAMRISRVYGKEKILELYLNEIFLGLRSYGVGAAALNYFDKSLDELTIEEVALLAAMPKAPSTYNPRRNYDKALVRRNWVITRMQEDGYITEEEAEAAQDKPIVLRERSAEQVVSAPYFSEEVRRWLSEHYGKDVLYNGGLVVKTTVEPGLQEFAEIALQKALEEYDRNSGYRGVVTHFDEMADWREQLKAYRRKHAVGITDRQRLAVVLKAQKSSALIGFDDMTQGIIPLSLLGWTKSSLDNVGDVLNVGDVVIVGKPDAEQRKKLAGAEAERSWDLQQIPTINGAFIAMEPNTGKVLAMVGGYSAQADSFNRATQARRQPGSAFKPFVYMAGLEYGLTPSTNVLDSPIELSQGEGLPTWKPENYGNDYEGLVTLRWGLEKSRNTMTVRLAQAIGIERILEIGKRFGIYDDLPRNFSTVLGAAETTLVRMAGAYSMIANGGMKVEPHLIERIDDRHGNIVYRRDTRDCVGCELSDITMASDTPPQPKDNRIPVADPRIIYQITSILQGVVQRGTGVRALSIQRPLAGKTGTTNDSRDTWFMGFTPDLVAGVYIGFDTPKPLGKRYTGSTLALPAFITFMQKALADQPAKPFRVPPGIRFQKASVYTGKPPGAYDAAYQRIVQARSYQPQEYYRDQYGRIHYVEQPPLPAYKPDPGPFIYEAYLNEQPVYLPPETRKALLNTPEDAPTESETADGESPAKPVDPAQVKVVGDGKIVTGEYRPEAYAPSSSAEQSDEWTAEYDDTEINYNSDRPQLVLPGGSEPVTTRPAEPMPELIPQPRPHTPPQQQFAPPWRRGGSAAERRVQEVPVVLPRREPPPIQTPARGGLTSPPPDGTGGLY